MNGKKTGLLLAAILVALAGLSAVVFGDWDLAKDSAPKPTSPAASVSMATDTSTATPGSGLPTIDVRDLPVEARDTLTLIDQGGPFKYKQDGVVFENRERRLPRQGGGYYHEYTVDTPGETDRGPRRLITGSDGDLYYTEDHYATFRQVLR